MKKKPRVSRSLTVGDDDWQRMVYKWASDGIKFELKGAKDAHLSLAESVSEKYYDSFVRYGDSLIMLPKQ